jgi:hypothetical protein
MFFINFFILLCYFIRSESVSNRTRIQVEKTVFYVSLVSSSKFIGAGLATIGLAGAGMGIGVLFGDF